jgi:hypothetical protein
MDGAAEVIHAIDALSRKGIRVSALQDYHKSVSRDEQRDQPAVK